MEKKATKKSSFSLSFFLQDSVQSFTTRYSFNESRVSVLRGRVVAAEDGGPVMGVRVSVKHEPLWGFTLTRSAPPYHPFSSHTLRKRSGPSTWALIATIEPWYADAETPKRSCGATPASPRAMRTHFLVAPGGVRTRILLGASRAYHPLSQNGC